jgi:hypothetical protein
MRESPKYFTDKDDQPPFLKALAEVRRIGVHEGWCYHHVQAIMMSIDQYAEDAGSGASQPHQYPAAILPRSHRR